MGSVGRNGSMVAVSVGTVDGNWWLEFGKMAVDELLDDSDEDGPAREGRPPRGGCCGIESIVGMSPPNKRHSPSDFQSLLLGSQGPHESVGLGSNKPLVISSFGAIENMSSDGGQDLVDSISVMDVYYYDTARLIRGR